MKRIKKIWKQLFGNAPYPPDATLCEDIVYAALSYRERYMCIVSDVENHRISREADECIVLKEVQASISILLEMLLQLRNLLYCVSHEPLHQRELDDIIDDIEWDYDRVSTEITMIRDDFDRLRWHLGILMGVRTSDLDVPPSYYHFQEN